MESRILKETTEVLKRLPPQNQAYFMTLVRVAEAAENGIKNTLSKHSRIFPEKPPNRRRFLHNHCKSPRPLNCVDYVSARKEKARPRKVNERITELYEAARDKDYTVGRKKFAEILGVTRGQLNGWLENAGNPDLETLKKVAIKAGVSTSWLIGEEDRRNYPSFEMSGLTPSAKKDYDLLLEFPRFKYRREQRLEQKADK